MAQHFLLSAQARTLSLAKVMRLSEEEAYATFRQIRWASERWRALLPTVRLRGGLHVPFAAHLQVPGLRKPILDHHGHDLRQPQAADPRLAGRYRDLRERGQGYFRLATEPRPRLPVQDGFRPGPQVARSHGV